MAWAPLALTLAQLRTTMTEDEVLDSMLANLATLGFATTSWQSGSVQYTLLKVFARLYAQLTTTVSNMSKLCFLETSQGTALTSLADSHYDVQRVEATACQVTETLTGGAVGPPYAIVPGQLVVEHATLGYTYRNSTAFVVPAGGNVTAPFTCQTVGAAQGAVGIGSITILQTPLAGVTVTNAAGYLLAAGADQETDDVLRERCRTKWAVLNYAKPADGYIYMALTADESVQRVLVDDTNPGGPGTVWVYVASSTGAVGGAVVTAVQDYIDARRPVTALVTVIDVGTQPQTFTGDIYITNELNTVATHDAIEAAVVALVNSLPIGGDEIPPGGGVGYLGYSELLGAITSINGVRRVDMTLPVADTAIAATSVMTTNLGAITFNYLDAD